MKILFFPLSSTLPIQIHQTTPILGVDPTTSLDPSAGVASHGIDHSQRIQKWESKLNHARNTWTPVCCPAQPRLHEAIQSHSGMTVAYDTPYLIERYTVVMATAIVIPYLIDRYRQWYDRIDKPYFIDTTQWYRRPVNRQYRYLIDSAQWYNQSICRI